MKGIQILDYGSGNLFSIQDALVRASPETNVFIDSKLHSDIAALILPGVGSFASAQKILNENRQAILKAVNSGSIALLGICLGMQLLYERSEEGAGEGLSLFRGKVKRFAPHGGVKVPHMGWNTIAVADRAELLDTLAAKEWVYYVHSYFPEVKNEKEEVKAWTEYGGVKFPAVIAKGRVFGTQFHPEKSHFTGARILSNFLKLVSSENAR